jgi:ornithine--oxo-acid transaminase
VSRAVHEALDADLPNLVQMDCALLPGVLAQALVERAHPGIERVFFTNSGAEAVESAIKFARCATKRDRVLYCDHAFHGLTTGALSLNGGEEFRRGFGPLLPGPTRVPFGDAAALEAELRAGDVAAFVAEPIQGKGVYMAAPEYWAQAQELCRKYKTLLVTDEVQTGFGRTGAMFCYEHWGLQPDIVTVSKALSGGYVPVGAMMCSAKVSDAVYSSMDRAVVHSSTFSTNQLAMVAGLATLQAFEDEDIVDRARRMGDTLVKALAPLVERHEYLHEVRGKGLMVGLVFGEPASGSLRRRWKAVEAMRTGMFSQMVVVPLFQRHRILTQVAADNVNVVKLLPPLIVSEEQVDYFVDALDDVLSSAEKGNDLLFEFGTTLARGTFRRALS